MRPFNVLALAFSPARLISQRLLLGCILILTVLLGGASGSLALPVAAPPVVAQSQAYCEELLINPGFETRTGWELVGVESPPQYTTDRAYRGDWSMRLGIVGPTNVASISAAQQTIQIPTFASSLTLSMRYWPISGGNPGNDLQYIDIYNGYNNQFIKRIWSDLASIAIMDVDGDGDTDEVDAAAQEWLFVTRDLTDVKALTDKIRIFFAVTNDGGGGTTALYLDDVQLRACDTQPPATATRTPSPSATVTTSPSPTASGTATATSTSTPSATPTPVNQTPSPTFTPGPTAEVCVGINNLVRNGGFEENGDWIIGLDPYPPSYDTGERFSGGRSMRLGVPSNAITPNVPTYSSVRQMITIPSNAINSTLYYQIKSRTDQAPDPHPSNVSDRQELILLNPDLSTLSDPYPDRVLSNANSWELRQKDLTGYVGKTFFIYFNVYNDGNGARTWAYLDEVRLCITTPAVPTPTITPMPSATSMATSTATSTATPTATPTAIPEIATATPTATEDMGAAADPDKVVPDATLLAQAIALATQAAGTPVFDPNVQDAGREEIGSNRPITPEGQAPVLMTPVPRRSGLNFDNWVGGLMVIGLVILFAILVVMRRMGNQGSDHPRPGS